MKARALIVVGRVDIGSTEQQTLDPVERCPSRPKQFSHASVTVREGVHQGRPTPSILGIDVCILVEELRHQVLVARACCQVQTRALVVIRRVHVGMTRKQHAQLF
eukprot:6693086-Prymnesium_polylepis.2